MNNIWHNSNEEQPDGKRRTVCYCLNTNGGEVGIHTIVNPNYRWAYLEDLDPEYVECGNCVNDKGCIVCEHGEQKQLCWNNLSERQKSDFFYNLSHQK
jgi:hypothetical protein